MSLCLTQSERNLYQWAGRTKEILDRINKSLEREKQAVLKQIEELEE